MKVTNSGKASGILTNNTIEEEFPSSFSPDDSCPNKDNGEFIVICQYIHFDHLMW